MATPRLPRVVNAQRMGARLHLCVEDLGHQGQSGQRCACGQVVVQSDEILLGRDRAGQPVDWREWDLTERDVCRRCWPAYLALRAELDTRPTV